MALAVSAVKSRRNRRSRAPWIALVIAAALCLVFSQQILWQAGAMMVNDQPPVKADAAVVLGGDYGGDRITKAAQLAQAGYVPIVIVSGGGGFYGQHESDLEIDYAVRKGFRREMFVPVRHPAFSTKEEAQSDVAELRQRSVRSILLVTSPSHTARATRVFHAAWPEMEIHPVAARDPKWNNGYWWKIREGRKTWLYEFLKTISGPFGI